MYKSKDNCSFRLEMKINQSVEEARENFELYTWNKQIRVVQNNLANDVFIIEITEVGGIGPPKNRKLKMIKETISIP